MPKASSRFHYSDYIAWTRDVTVSFALLFPLLTAYEILILLFGLDRRNSAELLLKDFSGVFGGLTIWMQRGVVLMTLLLGVRVYQRDIPLARIFPYFLIECAAFGVLLGPLVSTLLQAINVPLRGLGPGDRQWVLSIGAGVYEELLFRFLLLAAMYSVLHKALGASRRAAYATALVLSAAVFSAYHHWGPHGEPFSLVIATFRFLAGMLLGLLFLHRGLAACAYVHAFYDLSCDLRDYLWS